MTRRHVAPLETLSIEALPEAAVPAFEAALQTVCSTVGLFRDEATDTWRVEGVREAGAGDDESKRRPWAGGLPRDLLA